MFGKIVRKVTKFISRAYNQVYYLKSYIEFIRYEKEEPRFKIKWKDRLACLEDRTSLTDFDRHYVYHIAWAVRTIKKINPYIHIDISSSLYFSSTISAFILTEFYDIRPAKLDLPGLKTSKADLTKLPFGDNSILSLSCMHAIEHVGLGRYGDPIDYNGDIKAFSELARVLAHGGDLLVVVPIGNVPLIQFNAHRIYDKDQVINMFSNLGLQLKEFTIIPENQIDGGLVKDPDYDLLFKQKYACGCFWLKK
jgi:SAM-dependent methyltransferase